MFNRFPKKSEYGPASITIKKKFNDCSENYLLEIGSNIVLNNKTLLSNSIKVIDQLYGNKYGTKTIK